ncbi:MAG: hypothetical protein M1840_005043 [Geoglossum simile]|nr:MAG: hypothetical protein M1840_005043 [Geoglossum simile]
MTLGTSWTMGTGLGRNLDQDQTSKDEDLHNASDEEPYEGPEDELYDEWLRQLEEEGIDEKAMA